MTLLRACIQQPVHVLENAIFGSEISDAFLMLA